MTESAKYNVIYQGSKLFWRTRNTIDVTIVQHFQPLLTEIIAYEPSINVEAKRIYLDSGILRAKLDQAEIDAKFSFAKQNNVPITTEFTNKVTNRAITDFVLTRLNISEFSREERRFDINLEFKIHDRIPAIGCKDNTDQLICEKKPELQPYETKNHKKLAPGEVDAALKALEDEKRSLDATCTQAAELHAEATVTLTVKERWRIPIVLGKLDKGKTLNAGDSNIWEAVSRNIATQEDIDRATKVTVQTVTTPAQQAAKKAAKAAPSSAHYATPLAHKVSESPARSPLPTPRAISRANSSRLFAGTVTSQLRVQCASEDNSPVPAPTPKAHTKKLVKQKSSRTAHGTPHSKGHRAHNRAHTHGQRDRSDANVENDSGDDPDFDHSGSLDALAGIEESARGGFISQVAAGLSSIAASVSSKLMPSTASAKEVESGETEINDALTMEVTPQHHHLADLVTFLMEGKSTSQSLKTSTISEKYTAENTSASEDAATQSNLVNTGFANRNISLTTSADAPVSLVCASATKTNTGTGTSAAVPAKRRSYFGTLLAALVGTDDKQASGSAKAASGYIESEREGTVNDVTAAEKGSFSHDSPPRSKPTADTPVGTFMPWSSSSHGNLASATVVPVDLVN